MLKTALNQRFLQGSGSFADGSIDVELARNATAGSNLDSMVWFAGVTEGTAPTMAPITPAAPAVTVAGGATAEIDGVSAQPVTFSSATGTLVLKDAPAFTGQVSGLTGSDTLDLADISYGPNTTASFSGNATGGTLTITNGTQTANIALTGDYLQSGWTLSSDGHGGTDVVDPPLPVPVISSGVENSNDSVTLTGTAPDGSTVALSDGGSTALGTVTANSSTGAWSFTTAALPVAAYAFTATDTTSAGTSASSNTFDVTVTSSPPAAPVIFYVSSEIGNNDNAGTSESAPLATLQAAEDLVKPGDIVEVMNGTYTTGGNGDVLDITTSGTANAPITFEAAPGQTPVINSSGSWNAINIEASYIVVDGFTVEGDAANYTLATALAGYSSGNPNLDGNGIVVNPSSSVPLPNNITIENNTVYNEPGGGIGTEGADYVQILNNVVYGNAHWSAFGNSGISVSTSANLNTNSGVHDIISGNTVFGNAQLVPTTGGNTITDGEGIILDTNPGYTGEILVENNTVYSNGSSGIESFLTNNAVITGNTVYGNNTQNVMPASDAEILINQSNNNTVTNNTTTAPDPTPPAAPVISGDTVNYGNTVMLRGTAEVDSTITVFDNSTQLGTTVANSSGAWTFTTGALANGSQSFTATATNSVGDVSPLSSALGVTLNEPVNLVANGNFATGDFTDWTLGGNDTSGQIFIDTSAEGGSTYAAGMGSMGADGTISQTIATTAGQTYTLSFWLQNEGSGGNDFKAIWNGQTLLSLTNATQSGYTEYTYTVTATSSTTTLEFSAANGPSQWDLDNISLTANGTSTTTPPAAPVISTGVANSNESVTLTGTAPDGSTVTVSDGGKTALGTATASSTGAWSFTTADLSAGAYAFTATDTTSAGTSAASSAFDVTVTPPPPATPVISTGVANSNESVTLTGTAPDGSTVTVSDGGKTALGTATASSTGAWSFTTADLSAGAYAFTATDTTSAGTSAASSAFDVTVKSSAPAAPVMSTGVANSNESVTLTGTAPDGSTVTVSDGGATALGTATASSTGAWSFTTADLSAGAYAFTATDTTSAGTSAASSAFDVTVTPPPPAAPVISTGVANSNESVTLTGTAPDGSTVTVSDGGATALGTATASSTGAWSFTTADLSAGAYAFTATDTTSAGTSAASSAFDVTVTPPPPAAPVISTGVANSNESVTLTGTAADGSTVTVSDGGKTALGTATASSTGAWSFTTADLSAGAYAFTATDTTSAGTSAASSAFDVTVTPPPPAAPVISTGVANSNESVTLTGTAADGSTVTVSDGGATALGTATASSTGAWSFTTADLSAGAYAFTATDTTSAGTSAASSAFDVTVTPPPPAAPVISTGAANSNESVTLTGTAPDGSTVTVSDGGATALGTATASSTGAWSFTTADLSAGAYAFTATDTTSAGTSAASSAFDVTVTPPPSDPTLSSIVESPASGDLDAGKTVTLTLTLNEAVTVNGTPTLTLNDGGTATYTTGTGTDALTFSYTVGAGQNASALAITSVNLPNGATITNSTGQNAALNLTDLTQTGPQIDTTAPVISSIAESPSSGDLNAGKTVTYTIGMSEAVTVNTAGGSPTLALNDGGTAVYASGSGTNALAFVYTVAAGQNTPDLQVTEINLNGATISDGAGNAANLSLTGLTQGSPQIDTMPPVAPVISGDTVSANTVTLNGTAEAGSTIAVFDNSTQLGTATANSSGAWTFTTGVLANGSQSFTATATDGAGNVSPLSSPLAVVLNAPGNLVANGNFATGNFTDWTLGGNDGIKYGAQQIFIDTHAEGGSTYAAGMGSMGADGTISQTVATTPGQTYTLSFWLENEGSGGNDFKAIWNGQTLLSLTNATQSGYTEYAYTVTATGSTTTLEFSAANNPSQWDLDNVSLKPVGITGAPPPPVITSDTNNGNKTVRLTGTAEDDSTVTVFDNGKDLGTTTANASGAWTFTTGKLSNGSQVFTATDTVAGNTSALSSPLDPIIGGGALANAVQSAIFVRLNNYIASSFAEVHSGFGYNIVSDALQNREQSPLTNPHHA